MEESIHERLALFFKDNKVNLTALAKTIDINRQSLYNYIDGTTSMKIVDLEKILTIYPKLDVVWLFYGIQKSSEVNEPAPEYNKKDTYCLDCKTKDRIIDGLLEAQTILKQSLHDCKKQLQSQNRNTQEKRKVG